VSEKEAPVRPDSLRSVLGAAVLFALVLLGFASVKSHRDLVSARDHERLLRTTITDTEHRIERLRGNIQQLRGDHDTLERLAREELGLVKPQDLVIVLPVEPGAPTVARIFSHALPASVPDAAEVPMASPVAHSHPAAAPPAARPADPS
jgi:cell division protein FtsB